MHDEYFDLLMPFQGFDLRPLKLEDFFAHDGSSPLPPVRAENRSRLDEDTEPLD